MRLRGKYRLGDLMNVMESANGSYGYNPVMGSSVASNDKKNNSKAVNDIFKSVENTMPKGMKERDTNPENAYDYNRTTLDYRFETEPSKEYKDRVEAQVKGFPSVYNMKNSKSKDNESLDYDGNEEFWKERKTVGQKISDMIEADKVSGLKTSKMVEKYPSTKKIYKSKTIFGKGVSEAKTLKRLKFRNTEFLSEAMMLNRVPEEYKTDGNRFIMEDAVGNEYLVECKVDDTYRSYKKLNVLGKVNKNTVNEELNRMQELFDYDRNKYGKTAAYESKVNTSVEDMVERVRQLSDY